MFYERSGLHLFSALGIDVFISLWYMILMAFIVFSPALTGGGMAAAGIVHGVSFALAVTLSLLVHEYGHGLVSKRYKLEPSILLHGFGGATMHRPASTDGKDTLVVLAGPLAGLAFGGICMLVEAFLMPGVSNPLLQDFVANLIWVNIAWSLLNLLLPIWPLDGGKLFHLLLRRFTEESKAREIALKISLGTAVVAGALAVAYFQSIFLAILAFFIVMDNLNKLQTGSRLVERSSGRSTGPSDFQSDLLEEAAEALEAEDWEKAYRLCHQLRASGGGLGDKVMDEIWRILAISATEMEKYEEAESYAERAPDSSRIREVRERIAEHTSI
mgnify:CR=1 FL=1